MKAKPPTALVAPMRAVLVVGGWAALIALPVSVGLGYLAAGVAGAWGGLIGMAIAVSFFAITVIVALATARLDTGKFGAVVLGSWLAKLVVLIGVLAALSGATFYNKMALFIALLVGVAGSLVLEALVVTRTRVPYTESSSP